MAKRTTKSDINNFIKQYKTGKTIYKISKETGFNPNTVKKWLRKNKVVLRDSKSDFSNRKNKKVNEQEVIKSYESGKSIEFILKKFNISKGLVRYYLEKNNIIIREKNSTKGGFSKKEKEKIIDLYTKQKRGAKYIGSLLQRSDTLITYWLNKWKIPKNARSEISEKIREVYGPTKGFSGRKHSNKSKKTISNSGKEAWNKEDRLPVIGKSRTFKTKIGSVLGTYEVAYLQKLIDENKQLPTLLRKRFKTPFGSYMPDFEFEDRFIEVKSEFTLKVSKGLLPGNDGKFSDKQWKKINWLNDNMKPVEIVVLDKKEAFNLFKKAINSNFVKDKVTIKNNVYKK